MLLPFRERIVRSTPRAERAPTRRRRPAAEPLEPRLALASGAAGTAEIVRISPNVGGRVPGLLARSFALRPPNAGPDSSVVVTGADLHRPRVLAVVERAYNAGKTVALAAPTEPAVERLEARLGHPGLIDFPDGIRRMDLVSFRSVEAGRRQVLQTAVLLPRDRVRLAPGDHGPGRKAADRRAAEFLARFFTAGPELPASSVGNGPQQSLLAIANAYQV